MTITETDTDRGREVVAADREGFEAFVHATGRRVHFAAMMLCGDHHLAEDLTQATYVKVFSRWDRIARTEHPLAYTYRILTNTFLAHRRLRRSSERPAEQLPDNVVNEPDRDLRLDLVSALQQLAPADRAVVVLRYWEDLSVARTAELLGIREDTCRHRAARALQKLRRLLPAIDLSDPEKGMS